MSVLIKGMEMPIDTCEIRMTIDMNGHWWATRLDVVDTWHEVVALPDTHGRLVDADALIEQMEADAEHMDEPYAKMMYYAAISDVRHAPTIVEEEGES